MLVRHRAAERLSELFFRILAQTGTGREHHAGKHRQQHRGGKQHIQSHNLPAQFSDHSATSRQYPTSRMVLICT